MDLPENKMQPMMSKIYAALMISYNVAAFHRTTGLSFENMIAVFKQQDKWHTLKNKFNGCG